MMSDAVPFQSRECGSPTNSPVMYGDAPVCGWCSEKHEASKATSGKPHPVAPLRPWDVFGVEECRGVAPVDTGQPQPWPFSTNTSARYDDTPDYIARI